MNRAQTLIELFLFAIPGYAVYSLKTWEEFLIQNFHVLNISPGITSDDLRNWASLKESRDSSIRLKP